MVFGRFSGKVKTKQRSNAVCAEQTAASCQSGPQTVDQSGRVHFFFVRNYLSLFCNQCTFSLKTKKSGQQIIAMYFYLVYNVTHYNPHHTDSVEDYLFYRNIKTPRMLPLTQNNNKNSYISDCF